MTNLAFGTSATTLLAIAYAYDADDRRTSERWSTDRAMGYAYNALNQLASGTWSGSLTAVGEANYAQGAVTVNNVAAQLYPDRTFETASIPVADGTNTLAAIYHGPAFTNTQTVATNVVTAILADTAFAHDALGRRTLARTGTDAHASGTRWHYDPATGRLAWQEDLAGNRTTFGYDPATGRRTAVTDALSNTVHTAYDPQGRVTNIWGATYPVGYVYDDYGRLAALHTWRDPDADPDTTRWLYDEATGLLTNKLYADGLGPSYQYDARGNLTRRLWARGVATDYAYDPLGQLLAITYSDSTPDVAYTYDRLGRPLTITDVLGTRTNVYDALTLLEEQLPDGTVLARSYDFLGRPSGIALDADYAVGYAYDNFGRFASVAISNGVQFDYSYVSDSSLLAGWSVSNGAAAAYAYEPNRDLRTEVVNTFDGSPVSAFAYAYDAAGHRTQRVDSGLTTNLFGYNMRSELVDAIMGTNLYAYVYDPIGNRQLASANEVTNLYQANELNQYTNINAGVVEPIYDPDGNLTQLGPWTYSWDGENRLISVSSNGVPVLQNQCDYMSRRIMKSTATQTNTFRYDDWNLVREEIEAATSLSRSYVWGLDLSGTLQGAGGVGGLLQSSFSATNAFTFCDANGNITDLVDTNGAVVAHYEYDPYGNTIAQSSDQADANPFRFSSKYWDGETGFYDYGYRYYSPSMGRWINRDPIEEEGGGNLYAFINNTQINHTDPFGLVGTITVTTFDPYTNDSWFWHTRGWWFTAIWKPPSGGDWDKPCECKPCTKALWLQRAKWSLRRPYLPDIAVGMHDEWTEEEAGDYGNIWDCSSSNAGMGDRPSFGVAILSTVSSWLFVANSYVKCVEGKDAGTVYGGVWWSARWKHDTVFGSGPLIY